MTTTKSPATDTTPRVWLGCMHHYNSGYLVGAWFDAETADEVTLADIHEGSGLDYVECEEIWGYDHENIPGSGEMDPLTAASWGKRLAEIDDHLRPALVASVRSGDYIAEGNTDLPCIPGFLERYCGQWESFDDHARQLADDIGLLDGLPEEIANYFDWRAWTRDLSMDYSTYDNPDGGVYVFRNL